MYVGRLVGYSPHVSHNCCFVLDPLANDAQNQVGMSFLTDLLEMNQFPLAGSVADWGNPVVSLHRQRPSYVLLQGVLFQQSGTPILLMQTRGVPEWIPTGAHSLPHKKRANDGTYPLDVIGYVQLYGHSRCMYVHKPCVVRHGTLMHTQPSRRGTGVSSTQPYRLFVRFGPDIVLPVTSLLRS
jgi:hypothetical protein